LEPAWALVAQDWAARRGAFPGVDIFNAALASCESQGAVRPASGCGVPLTLVRQKGRRARRVRETDSGAPCARAESGDRREAVDGRLSRALPLSSTLDENYQARLFLKGELLTRDGHPHDAFNALCHMTYPRTKATLNARQFWALDERATTLPWSAAEGGRRTTEQDALTHFDEGGIIVACSCPHLLTLLREKRWKELFVENRARLLSREGRETAAARDTTGSACATRAMEFFVFGHAIFEVVLGGHPTPHASGIFVSVDADFFNLPLVERLAQVDSLADAALQDVHALRAPADFVPVPVLGVPGYHGANAQASYYDNACYFRPARG